jgi:hypothetical protein
MGQRRGARRRRKGLALAVTIATAWSVLPVAAHAITLFTISGTARDLDSRTLAGVSVSDGAQTVTTAPDGTYTLSESATGRYTLTARRSDLLTSVVNVDAELPIPVTGADFQMKYVINGTLPNAVFNSVGGPVQRTLTVTTTAPLPGQAGNTGGKSCVAVRDSRTGATTGATFVNSNNGVSTWSWTLSVPQGAAAGVYSLSYVANDCASGVALTNSQPTQYVIDNTPPTVDPLSVVPQDHGNVATANTKLEAAISDQGGAGIATSGVSFTLEDTTAGSSTALTATELVAGTYAKRSVSLTAGHVYRLSVTATDQAGNQATFQQHSIADGGGFLVAPVNGALLPSSGLVGTGSASIPTVTCTVGDAPLGSTTRPVTCPNVELDYNPLQFSLAGSRHSGFGFVEEQASLQTALLHTSVLGVSQTSSPYSSTDPAWSPRKVSAQFTVLNPLSATTTVTASPVKVNLGTLTASVPATWTSATLDMAAVSAPATSAACGDPLGAAIKCTPDPVRFFTGDTASGLVAQYVQKNHQRLLEAGQQLPTASTDSSDVGVTTPTVYSTQLAHWERLAPACMSVDGTSVCLVDQVASRLSYLQGLAIEPRAYASLCAARWAWCWAPAVQASNSSPNIEAQKGEAYTDAWWAHLGQDWGAPCSSNHSQQGWCADWWQFIASTTIVFTGDRNEDNHSYCYAHDTTSAADNSAICWGFVDGAGPDLDGVGGGWSGGWYMYTCHDPATGAEIECSPPEWPYNATSDQAGNFYCFNGSNTVVYGDTTNDVMSAWNTIKWDQHNTKVGGSIPHWSSGGQGITGAPVQFNQSGAMKMTNHGTFTTSDGNDCTWTTFNYQVGGDVYRWLQPGTGVSGQMETTFTHNWTREVWKWTPSISGSPEPFAVAWNRDPQSSDTTTWSEYAASEPFDKANDFS